MDEIKKVLQEQISKIMLTEEERTKINSETRKFVEELDKNLAKNKTEAEVFVGGSLAKGTLIKKDKYDIDIFVRFAKRYEDKKIADMLGNLLKNAQRIHGSRDYFQVEKNGLIFEIVPTAKINQPEEARNVTDLSYFHVKYIVGKIKENKKLAEEIMLAKAFCYSNNCYGAESYINGFSGYALELLISYYESFVKFLKAIKDKDKIILDPEKFYKNKNEIMTELNESKLQSPIIFVDPTFKERNALAALSVETFDKFKLAATRFLENPDKEFFEKPDIEKEMKKEYKNLIIIETLTARQKGDIAGSKLRRFNEYLKNKLKRDNEIQRSDFEYDEKSNTGKNYFVLKPKKELIIEGPPTDKKENLADFKKRHKNCFVKGEKAYAKEKAKSIEESIEELKKDKAVKEMDITKIELIIPSNQSHLHAKN
jgi:tRNA CCA-adding enzyme